MVVLVDEVYSGPGGCVRLVYDVYEDDGGYYRVNVRVEEDHRFLLDPGDPGMSLSRSIRPTYYVRGLENVRRLRRAFTGSMRTKIKKLEKKVGGDDIGYFRS